MPYNSAPVSDEVIAHKKPITLQTGRALRDNMLSLNSDQIALIAAIVAGDAGAARIRINALQRVTAGDQIRSRRDASQSDSATDILAEVTGHSFGFMQAGSIRAYFEHSGTGSFAQVRRVRNSVDTVIGEYANSGSLVARSVDVDVLPGDLVYIYNSDGGAGSNSVTLQNCRFATAGEHLYPGTAVPLEGNVYE